MLSFVPRLLKRNWSAPSVEKLSILQKIARQKRKLREKLQKELKARRTSMVTSTAMSNYVIEGTTIVPCSAFTDSSANPSNSQDDAASAITSSWHRRKVAMPGQWSWPVNLVKIATTFSSAPCTYISVKWRWTLSLLYSRFHTFNTNFSTRYV